jgi:hypothetical protein
VTLARGNPDSFLGTQGDPWDAHWDMLCALGGAIGYLIFGTRIHDRQMSIAAASVHKEDERESRDSLAYSVWAAFLRLLGRVYLAWSPPRIKAAHIRELLRLIQPGCVLCTHCRPYTTHHLIPGKYGHSALVVDVDTAIHSVQEGVCRIDILDLVKDSDGFILLRPPYHNGDANRVVDAAWTLLREGTAYNFSYRERPAALYCHEFTNRCLDAAGHAVPVSDFKSIRIARRRVITADEFIARFEVIMEVYRPQSQPSSCQDSVPSISSLSQQTDGRA